MLKCTPHTPFLLLFLAHIAFIHFNSLLLFSISSFPVICSTFFSYLFFITPPPKLYHTIISPLKGRREISYTPGLFLKTRHIENLFQCQAINYKTKVIKISDIILGLQYNLQHHIWQLLRYNVRHRSAYYQNQANIFAT
jgi:hypothetical protein